jgi:hypothetical protein
MRAELEPCKHKDGLGFKDLNFDEVVPRNLHSSIALLPLQIVKARRRMNTVRDLVGPHLDILANPDHPRSERRHHYNELQLKLDQRLGRPGR